MTPLLIFSGLLLLVFGPIMGVPMLIDRRERRRDEARLRAPYLGGIPLPMPDDPRWEKAHPSAVRLGPFHVERCFGRVFFESREIGTWDAYGKRVFAVFDAAEHAAMEKRALDAITGEPTEPPRRPSGDRPLTNNQERDMDPTETFDFSEALHRLKDTGCKPHRKLARAGWNGRGMWIVRQDGYPDGIAINRNTSEATGVVEGTVMRFLPYLMMRTAGGSFVPWLISQTDALAEDWTEVEPSAQ